ncbi:hypothetical protein THASP1DRAFT_17456 [Thamnocephalis sphaerospora]|uniref:tRNA (guanine(10)-N(2))-methyltransferase TRMT11 N-terminal domain-containing protein n=1 Tax=Thamnocephalis sphaerospora TaxID=78915 RepID=A0A4P9XMN0_9FUNG|nr:hypothetical protein THASP1DRAFT_17456 [Thamnocephalis sphaerospora]|eukprot:RKP07173.1 hypothetical protein THASP1DRAFT_17456 [Thamnocephalis sphaerospora]
MPRYLIQFAQSHDQFRLPELLSLAKLEGVNIAGRVALSRSIYELWASQETYDSLHREVKEHPERWPEYKHQSFKFNVVVFGGTQPWARQLEIINSFSYLAFEGKIDMKNASICFVVVEDYELDFTREELPEHPSRLFFGRLVANGNRDAVKTFDLKKRKYLSNTSMDAELSLVMANQAMVAPGKIAYDPFVGSGIFLFTCSYFGAYTLGSDIDGRQIRGRDGRGVHTNVEQYALHGRVLDTMVFDVKNHPWRSCQIFDAIVTAPYGVRAGAKQLGRKEGKEKPVRYVDGEPAHLREDYYPPTRPYEMADVVEDLHAFAAQHLVLGGRLVYWLPTIVDEYEAKDIPEHPCLRLVANSEQAFGVWSRRLITLEKVRELESETPAPPESRAHTPAHAKFRTRYFQPNSMP